MRVGSTRGAAPSGVRIRLLGPVEVMDGCGRVVPLGGPRLRALIGALGLRAPDVVSRDILIEGVWDADPPAGAEKTLRAHVAYLRRGLFAGGIADLVATRSPGYALAAPAGCVDVHRFLDLVGQARAATTPQSAASTLRTALGLWRGDVLAGCPSGSWVRAEATRLREARLNAIEDVFAAELMLGRHAAVAAELESMVSSYPLRERLWELLMHALYRAGRQGEALRAYRRVRALLVREIGVEPGAGLRRLEAAILTGREVPDDCRPAAFDQAAVGLPAADRTSPGAVPTPLTRLIGRRAEISELCALLGEHRLITLTGVGGSGKTRLALSVAERAGAGFAGGVWFVDLAPLTDPALVTGAIADGIGCPVDPDCDTADALARHLGPRHSLLVLDNCECVVASCAKIVTTLLRRCPDLCVLATSRESLGVLGEVAWPVPTLAVPPPSTSDSIGLAELSGYDAVRLFLDRADVTAVRGFTDGDGPGIAALCARLDGLPLAIELAAARTAVLSVAEITDRLHDPALLRTTRHADRPHHRAMHATIAWSYDLLDPLTQDRFRRLAVFTGGFTIAAADTVWGGDLPAVDMITDLAAKSLVVVDRDALGARYRLLETIARFASARLAECPEAERDARARHAEHYLTLAEEADRHLHSAEAQCWLARLTADHENLRAALSWFAGAGHDPVSRLRLAVALTQYCRLRGRYVDGRQWLEQALDGHADAPPGLVGLAHTATAVFALLTCDYDQAQRLGERAMGFWGQAEDYQGRERTLRLLASVARERGDYPRALTLLARARTLQGADDTLTARGLFQTGFTWWLAGDLDRAERAMTAALEGSERLGDPVTAACLRVHLGLVALGRGQLDLADRLAGEGLTRCRELDTQEGVAWAWHLVGLIGLRRNRFTHAIAALRASLEVHHGIGDRWRQASVLATLAETLMAAGDPVRAAELAGLARAIRDRLDVPVPAQERPAWENLHAALRRCLPDTELRAALTRGTTLRIPEVITNLDNCDVWTQPDPADSLVTASAANQPTSSALPCVAITPPGANALSGVDIPVPAK
jgi:predicted ATPase/DNA-binding SARP family transcriptional activator